MDVYIKSFLFFTKVSLSCTAVQWGFDNYFNVQALFLPIFYPFFHWLANFLFYYSCGFFSVIMKDSTYFSSYKINQPFKIKRQTMKFDLFGTVQGELIFLLLCHGYKVCHFIDYNYPHSSSILKNILWFYLCIFSADLSFYIIHRILHQKQFYWIHKKHHEFIDVNGFVAEYKSLIESIIITTSDILPFILFGCSIHQLLAWIIIGVIYNVEGHSSMNIFFIQDNFHYKHHTHFNVNYGIAQYLDRIFGTHGGSSTQA